MTQPIDYPPVPPGVRMFDPRRLRRHARNIRRDLQRREKANKWALSQAQAKAARVAAVKTRLQATGNILSRVVGKLGRFIGRGRKQ